MTTTTAHNPELFCATLGNLHRVPAWRAFWSSYTASDYSDAGGSDQCGLSCITGSPLLGYCDGTLNPIVEFAWSDWGELDESTAECDVELDWVYTDGDGPDYHNGTDSCGPQDV